MESDDGSDISEISTRSSSRLPAVRISGSASNLSGTLPVSSILLNCSIMNGEGRRALRSGRK